jgi:hypothetical protein
MKDATISETIDPTWLERTGGYAKDMTLLDYFAAKAMQQFIATAPKSATDSEICAEAYGVAEQMLKERSK